VPDYHHHPLIGDESGRRLAKRTDAISLKALRDQGLNAAEVRALAGFAE
jgi:glutamyl-Q tRNA(Asp) synthetase